MLEATLVVAALASVGLVVLLATLLTPPSTLRALGAGYRPVLHPSAVELMA